MHSAREPIEVMVLDRRATQEINQPDLAASAPASQARPFDDHTSALAERLTVLFPPHDKRTPGQGGRCLNP
jgi:hypothetical protein